MPAGISVFLPYTIGTDTAKGQVVPSECNTQFTESRWAHLRALHHRGNRGGGRVDAALKGRAFPLEAVADDQCHLVYRPELSGLHADLNTQHGQSVLSRAERRAEQEGSVPTYQLNTHIPKWVLDKPGVRDDWKRFERLFLTPHDFRAGEDYVLDAPGVGGLVGRTAEKPQHRQLGPENWNTVISNLHKLPAEPSVTTQTFAVNKTVRLVIEPPQEHNDTVVANGAVALVYRTSVQEMVDGHAVPREPVESIRAVRRSELVEMVKQLRDEDEDEAAARAAVSGMVVQDDKNKARSLRHEVWAAYERGLRLENAALRSIFTPEVLGSQWTWVEPPDQAVQSEPAAPPPQTNVEGWRATFNTLWNRWIYTNDSGAVSLVDPEQSVRGEEGDVRTGAGGAQASGAAVGGAGGGGFAPPASAHVVPAVDDPMELGDV